MELNTFFQVLPLFLVFSGLSLHLIHSCLRTRKRVHIHKVVLPMEVDEWAIQTFLQDQETLKPPQEKNSIKEGNQVKNVIQQPTTNDNEVFNLSKTIPISKSPLVSLEIPESLKTPILQASQAASLASVSSVSLESGIQLSSNSLKPLNPSTFIKFDQSNPSNQNQTPFLDLTSIGFKLQIPNYEEGVSISSEFREAYIRLIKSMPNCVSFSLRTILNEMKFPPELEFLIQKLSDPISNIRGIATFKSGLQLFSIPYNFNAPFDQDVFPGDDKMYRQMISNPSQYLAGQIILSFYDETTNRIKRINLTENLKSFSWNLFRVGLPFRPHALDWLFNYVQNASFGNILISQGVGKRQRFAHIELDTRNKKIGREPEWISSLSISANQINKSSKALVNKLM